MNESKEVGEGPMLLSNYGDITVYIGTDSDVDNKGFPLEPGDRLSVLRDSTIYYWVNETSVRTADLRVLKGYYNI